MGHSNTMERARAHEPPCGDTALARRTLATPLLRRRVHSHAVGLDTPSGHNHPRATAQGNVPHPLHYRDPIRKWARAASPHRQPGP